MVFTQKPGAKAGRRLMYTRGPVHSMPNLDYFVVDVFTGTPLKGNPLAVVMNNCALTTDQMQAIAREFNLSETTFVERRETAVERAAGVRVRVFTTQEELPFAGHPTLGTASVLKLHAPEAMSGDTLTLALNVGPVPVRFEERPGDSSGLFGEMTQPDPQFGKELDAAEVAPLLGLTVADLDAAFTPQVVSTGSPFAIVVLRTVQALERLKVKQDEATAWLRERAARWFYVLAPDSSAVPGQNPAKWRARMQFYGGEDPATGSAAGCAIGYLVARGAVASDARIQLRQGVEIGRPSDLFLTARRDLARVSDVRVAGSTVLVATGQLFLP
jgi:trans-2,3-dihydro-3-hydroxyanthranilate isomerase